MVRYLPWFQLWDPYVTRELTIRDLLVHRSGLGLGAGDLLWWPSSTYTRREIAHRLRFIQPATSFRSAYAYDNVLYLIAGEVIEALSGQSYEDFIAARILTRIGMSGSTVRHSDAAKAGNIAVPHAAVDGRVKPIAPFDSDNTNPAGGINSNAHRHGEMDERLPRSRAPGRRFAAVLGGDLAPDHHAGDPDADRQIRRRSLPCCVRTSADTGWVSTRRTIAAGWCSCTPAGSPATSRAS